MQIVIISRSSVQDCDPYSNMTVLDQSQAVPSIQESFECDD